jgi:hypothetical protein
LRLFEGLRQVEVRLRAFRLDVSGGVPKKPPKMIRELGTGQRVERRRIAPRGAWS